MCSAPRRPLVEGQGVRAGATGGSRPAFVRVSEGEPVTVMASLNVTVSVTVGPR